MISNCGTPTEKVSEFLYFSLKSLMQEGSSSYITDSGDLMQKKPNLKTITNDAILLSADVAGLYLTIPHDWGLEAMEEALGKREIKHVSIEDLLQTLEFILKNSYFEFNVQVKQRISGIAVGTKCAPLCAGIFMEKVEIGFLMIQENQPLVWY